MKPSEDTLFAPFESPENKNKPFVITGGGNVIVNVDKLSAILDELRITAGKIVEEDTKREEGKVAVQANAK